MPSEDVKMSLLSGSGGGRGYKQLGEEAPKGLEGGGDAGAAGSETSWDTISSLRAELKYVGRSMIEVQ